MRPVDFLTSLSHYGDHLAPIWHALDPAERGTWWAPPVVQRRLTAAGVERHALREGRPTATPAACVVASAMDLALAGARPVVLVEHGVGQAYDRPNPSYSGGPGRDRAVLFLCPNEVTAARNRAAYPDAAAEVVGSPRLDALMAAAAQGDRPASSRSVALSFHWDCPFVPETRWAYPHYKRALPELVAAHDVVGHGHPRFATACANRWRQLGIDHEPDFDKLPARAQLYVADNSSSLYEWAALDRPVLVLNAPSYRRELEAWPRFWACADVGVQVDEPAALLEAVGAALEDLPAVAARRAEVVEEVWPLRDGRAANRAVDALRATLN